MLGLFKKLIFPHEKNNYRSGILHNSAIFAVIIAIFISTFFLNYLETSRPDVLGVSYSISDNELLALVNKERQDRGLGPLTLNAQLADASRRKAADMFEKNYWAHFAPDGSTSPWGFIRAAGYDYLYAGENLAKGFTDSGSVVSAWMNSPSHRDNILSTKYKEVGFAIVPGTLSGEETVLIVEMLGASSENKALTAPPPVTAQAANIPDIPNEEIISTPIPEPTAAEVKLASPASKIAKSPTIDSRTTPRAASTIGLSFLAFTFIMDLVIVERKKIPRIVGHNLDHIMLIVMFILFIYLTGKGVII